MTDKQQAQWQQLEARALEGLEQTDLLRKGSFIDGEFLSPVAGAALFEVTSPASGGVLAEVHDAGDSESQRALDGAAKAFKSWKQTDAGERGALLEKLGKAMHEELDNLATLLTLEHGKPLDESRSEIRYAASFLEFYAAEASRSYGEIIPSPSSRRLLVVREPVGVGAGIVPWNFPSAMVTRKLAPALAAGCTFLLKPSESTPLSALALAALAERVGLPPGVFQVLVGSDSSALTTGWLSDPRVRKLSFTGSTGVGKDLYELCAPTLKRVSLELGGNAPFIVFDDADLEVAAKSLRVAKFRNGGQSCVAANRVYVHRSIIEEFAEKVKRMTAELVVGHGLEKDSSIGPLIEARALKKVEKLIEGSAGFSVLAGGAQADLPGHFFEPTVLIQDAASEGESAEPVVCEEVFGPVITLIPFDEEDEVVARANSTPYGLASYFFTRAQDRAWRVAAGLEFGMVGVNTGLISNAAAPFGGVKESGLGREGSRHGLHEWQSLKYIAMAGL